MAGQQTATLVQATVITPGVRELTLQPDGDTLIDFRPGQWLSFTLPIGDKGALVRAYSLGNAPRGDGTLTITFDLVGGGIGSEYLWNVEPGETLSFTGPMGNFTLPDGDAPLLFLARYTGIVPFRAMLQALERGDAQSRTVHLVYGIPNESEILYHDELKVMAANHAWFDYHPIIATLGDERTVLERHAADWMPCTPMVCGVREFTAPTRAYLMEKFGLERRDVILENYNGPSGR